MSRSADVKYDIDNLRHNLELPETEETWDKIAAAFKAFTKLCEAGAFDANPTEIVTTLRSSHRQIVGAMNSERTRLSLTALDFISALATAMGRAFDQVMPLFLPALLGLCARTNKVIIKSARGAIFTIIETTQLVNVLSYLQQNVKDKSASLKLVIAEGTLACLNSCNPPDLEKESRAVEVEDIIRVTARDANADVRKVSRKIFDSYKILMPYRITNFTAPMSPTTKKYLDIKALATQPSTSNLKSTAPVKIDAKPSTSIRPGHSRATSTSTTASTMQSTHTRNAPSVMTRVARKDLTTNSTTFAPVRPAQAMRITTDSQTATLDTQRRSAAPVRPARPVSTAEVKRPVSSLSVQGFGPSRGTTVATSTSQIGAPHRLQVKSTTQLVTNSGAGPSSGPRRVPVMAPPPPPPVTAKEKEGPKRPISRIDNATSTSNQRFVPTKRPAVPTAASSRDLKPAAPVSVSNVKSAPPASSAVSKGKTPATSTASSTVASKPAVSASSSRTNPGAPKAASVSTNAVSLAKALPAVKPKPMWGRPAQPSKPAPVIKRAATVPAPPAPQKSSATLSTRPSSRTGTTVKTAPATSKAKAPAPKLMVVSDTVEEPETVTRAETPEPDVAVETIDEGHEEEALVVVEEPPKTPESALRCLSPTSPDEEEEKEEIDVPEQPPREVEELIDVVENAEESVSLEEADEGKDGSGSLPSVEGPQTPSPPPAFSFGTSASTHAANPLASKTPISALLSSIERGFIYSPVTPLSPADLYLPNGATPYNHQTHAPHLQGGPRQPFNHALYAPGANGMFGGFAGLHMRREEDMVRGDLGVVSLQEHTKLFRGAAMSSLEDGNRQAFLELNQ